MKFSATALTLLTLPSFGLGQKTFSGTITLTNMGPTNPLGHTLTPVWVGMHNGNFDTYDRNAPAPDFLEPLAEDGNTAPIVAIFDEGSPGRPYDATSPAIPPGGSETISFSFTVAEPAPGDDYEELFFSYASMVIPSNDAFISNGNPLARPILFSDGTTDNLDFIVTGDQVLDAGTEVNDEIPGNTAGLAQAGPNTGVTEGGNVETHPGFIPGGNVLTARPGMATLTSANFQVMRVQVTFGGGGGGGGGGGAGGDPHFRRWNGSWYDFMGACDLVLCQAPHFADSSPLAIHVRTKIRYDYSYIESAIMELGEETFEVSSFGEYRLNGVSGVGSSELALAGFPIKYSTISDKAHSFEIQISDSESILLSTFKDMVSVKFNNANPERFGGSLGMLGSFDQDGEMVARDGATVIEDPVLMAAEWQVKNDDPTLFALVQEPQFPAQCIMPDAKTKEVRARRLGEGIAYEAAEKACSGWVDEIREACIYDVMATGDLEYAAAGAF